MEAGRGIQTSQFNDFVPFSPEQTSKVAKSRNLAKSDLGGVIFGCKNSTINECLSEKLFGLPRQHFAYVKYISPGLPLFLFNYSDRRLYGIFEAVSYGQMNISPYAWTSDGSGGTSYPAQVQIGVKLQCQPLSEEQFKPIISTNYYTPKHFYFELDQTQTSRLMSKLSAYAIAPSTVLPQNDAKGKTVYRPRLPFKDRGDEAGSHIPNSQSICENFPNPNERLGARDSSVFSDGRQSALEALSVEDVADEETKVLMYTQLKELTLNHEKSDASKSEHPLEVPMISDQSLRLRSSPAEEAISEGKMENTCGISFDASDHSMIIAQLLQDIEELKAFREEQTQKTDRMERKLLEAEEEIRRLSSRSMMMDLFPSSAEDVHADATREDCADLHLDLNESTFLVGGYDGVSWLQSLDLYSPAMDVLKSLKPMNSVRVYSSAVKLNGELYVFGGGDGSSWYNTVESYNAATNEWSLRASLNERKGNLAGASLNNTIFAMGGGNGVDCLSSVEMYDLYVGNWISTQSMLHKRFGLAAAALNGALYAVGGYDGEAYLQSAERFDPRENYWSRIDSMSTQRGYHSLVVMNEKLYALGGYDGTVMSPSVEMFDPRLGKWTAAEPMNHSRGYSAAAVLGDSIYIIGGVESDEKIVETVECYKNGKGWDVTNKKGPGRRCFCSAVVLGGD